MKCPKDNVELVHTSPSANLGIKHQYSSLVYVCDVCHGVWIENPQLAALRRDQAAARKADESHRVPCPSCQSMVGALVEAGPDFPGLNVCPHCAAILRYEILHAGQRISRLG